MKQLFANKLTKYDGKMIDYLLLYIEKEIDQIESRIRIFNDDLQKKTLIDNTSIIKRLMDNDTPMLEEQLTYVLGIIEGGYQLNFYYTNQGCIKEFATLGVKLDHLTKRINNVKKQLIHPCLKKISFTNQISLIQIVTKITDNKSMTPEDITSLLELPLELFLKDLAAIPSSLKQRAYQSLICTFIIDNKNNIFLSKNYSSEITEQIHNLVYFSYSDFNQFDDKIFWGEVYASKVKHYLLENFVCGIFRSMNYHCLNGKE